MAADAGQADAQVALANYLLRNKPDAGSFGKALDLLEKAAESDNREGKYSSRGAARNGSRTHARRDPKRALELLAHDEG